METVQSDERINHSDVDLVLGSILPPPTEETGKVWRLREVKLVERPGAPQGRQRHVTLLPRLEEVLVDILRRRVELLLLRRTQQSLYLITAGGDVVINLSPPLGSPANKSFFLRLRNISILPQKRIVDVLICSDQVPFTVEIICQSTLYGTHTLLSLKIFSFDFSTFPIE